MAIVCGKERDKGREREKRDWQRVEKLPVAEDSFQLAVFQLYMACAGYTGCA